MANNSPTLVMASLSDDQLKKSIDSLVTHVDEAMKKMVQSTNNAVGEMEAKLKSLGNLKIDSGGSADGGASKRTKSQNAETDAVEKNIAARDKQIKKNQEVSMSFDQMAAATQKAKGGSRMSVIETYDMQIEMFKNRLREVRQDIDIYNAAIGSGKKTQIEWGQQGLKQANAEAEKLMRIITTLENQRGNLANVLAPQGHTIQNYVNSLQKANPELAQLNDSFKRGQSLMQNGITTTQQLANAQGELNTKTNQQKQTLDEMNAYIRQNIQREQERRDAIRQTGLAAQQSYRGIVQSAREQLEINTGEPIKGVKELGQAIIEMRRAYYDMSDAERLSPIGQSLLNDIKKAEELRKNLDAFNRNITGIPFMGANNIVDVDKSIGSYANLSKLLKELTSEYQKLGREERNAAKGNDLADKIQRISRETQKIQQQMNRPISLAAAMKGDEKTLDDIAYKMRRLQSYRQGIDLTKPNAANEIKQVNEALARLQKDADKWMSKSQEMIKNNTALGRSWNYMKNRLAFYFTVGAGTQFIKNLIEVRSQYEMNERALGILIDSAERGTQIFNELSQMALVSPYTLIELSSAAKQLTAYDVAAKDVVDTTRRLADMAAAVGIPIERLTYALGQIKAYGYLNSRDARMFANAGIPLVNQLSDYYTELEGRLVSTADVYDRIKKKAIDYNEVMEVINKMTDEGGKFFDFQAKMADTLKVRLANLTLAWNNMLNDMGKETQGVLTWGIGALREMFLHWKQLDSLIKNAAWALGIRTALMFIAYSALKAGAALGVTTKQMALSAVFGERLANVLKTVAATMKTVAMSKWTWISLFAIAAVEATQAIFGVNEAQKALNESIRNGAKDNYNNISKFLEQYKEVRDSLYSTEKVAIGSIYNPKTRKAEATAYAEQQVEQDIDKNEAKKAWEAVREQIELTVASSDKYIGNLLSINNMSERVRQGFDLLEDIQTVNAALKELDDDTIKVSQDLSAWWNAWQAPDGLVGNLKDYQNTLDDIIAKYGTMESFRENTFLGGKGSDDLNDYETALERFRDDLQKTTDSIINFIELKGWSGDEGKINQVFEQITQKLILDNQLDPQKAFTLQTEVEEARSKAAKEALLQRINDEKAAYKISHDESIRQAINADVARYNSWNETNGRSKVEWERFTKWLKEQHISETTAMFRNMDAEDIKSLNFQEGKHAEWVTRMVTQYAKEHKMSYDEAFKYLRSWVRSANQWSIFIPLIISTEDKKSVYDQLGEYDKAIDDADAQIERLTKRINELNAKKKKSKEETQELANAEQELADAQKAKADAEAKGGHGKKEKKDEKAANKAAKQAESELAKALKDELSTIDKVRSIYKDLTKEGMSHANAVERATRGWDETVNAINRVLQKNGLQKLDLSKFAGIENPRELVNMLQSQLNTLLKRGAKPAEIKELQTKVNTLEVDADKYDLTKITKGLNNELGKLKDEYELAVELDANPEMGNLFADWMGVDMSTLPHTAEEYAKRMTKELNKYLADEKSGIEIGSLLALTDDDLRMFQQRVDNKELNQVWVDNIVKNTKEARNALKKENSDIAKEWDGLVQKYAEYEYKIEQVQRNANKERRAFALKYGSNAQKERALVLTTEIGAEKDQAKKQELINQLKQLLAEIAGDDDSKLKIKVAIDKKELEEGARVAFEEFQKSPEWIVATGDLAGMTHNALGMLIDDIEKYKKSAKNLSPKKIKEINRALISLYKQQRQNNPFKAMAVAMREAKERASVLQDEIDKYSDELDNLSKEQAKNYSDDRAKKIDELIKKIKKLKDEQKELTKLDPSTVIEGLQGLVGISKQVADSFTEMFDAIGGGEDLKDISRQVNGVFTVLDKTLSTASTGAQIGGKWGAIVGGVIGLISGLGSVFGGGKDSITEAMEQSEREVKRLENAYKHLEVAIEEAYGVAKYGAQQAAIANKKLQITELQRQLMLEKSRDSKDRDESKINDLMGQIEDLKIEIEESIKNITNDLLGISSVGSAAEELVSSMIDAFRKGEDYMLQYDESFEKMIDNMVMKAIVGRVIGDRLQSMWDRIDEEAKKRGEPYQKEIEELTQKRQKVEGWVEMASSSSFSALALGLNKLFGEKYGKTFKEIAEDTLARIEQQIKDAEKAYGEAIAPTPQDVQSVVGDYEGWRDSVKQEFDAMMETFGIKFGDRADTKQLSSLQQGLQSMSESTAESLEAYMNGVSQQVYLHSDLLTQIRDAVVGFDIDVQTASLSQILLQLQTNYIVMQSMHSMMEGWTTPSGQGIRVELLS